MYLIVLCFSLNNFLIYLFQVYKIAWYLSFYGLPAFSLYLSSFKYSKLLTVTLASMVKVIYPSGIAIGIIGMSHGLGGTWFYFFFLEKILKKMHKYLKTANFFWWSYRYGSICRNCSSWHHQGSHLQLVEADKDRPSNPLMSI